MPGAEVIVASNRGPVSFSVGADGHLVSRRGGGGLVSGLSAAMAGMSATWVCAVMSDADRAAARGAPNGRIDQAGHDTAGLAVRLLDLDPDLLDRAYNGIANATLWFVHHGLFDSARHPWYDAAWWRDWSAYEEYAGEFAQAIASEAAPGARVLVQDYHLALVPHLLHIARPDLRIGYFSHTPWPHELRLLPDHVAQAVVTGVLGAQHIGFLTQRWATNFVSCVRDTLGEEIASGRVAVHPLGVDAASLHAAMAQTDVTARHSELQAWAAGRQIVLRVDRAELSKNVVRGIAAFGQLLRAHPEHHDRVVHIVFAYPSRADIPEYGEYVATVQRVTRDINEKYGQPGWQPVRLEVSDDFPRSLAAMSMADVLVVNPVRDGMNLVAKEGPVLSREGVALVLSREAGAAAELGADALLVNPYDLVETAEAIHRGLLMEPDQRAARTKRLADAATALPPAAWLAQQLRALE